MTSALYVRRFSLNLISDLIGNHCSDLSRGVDSVHAANLFYIFRDNEQQRITVVKATAH